MNARELDALVKKHGARYSKLLGIDVDSGRDSEVFKWFLASILFGARIGERIAVRTFKQFESEGVVSAKKILETGWDGLVGILDAGGYTRYDFKTADKLLEVMGSLESAYGGSLNRLHSLSKNSVDLEKRIKELGKGIGDVTASIFLRELRGAWKKAEPKPTPLELDAAKKLGIRDLSSLLKKLPSKKAVALETALVRVGKELRRKK